MRFLGKRKAGGGVRRDEKLYTRTFPNARQDKSGRFFNLPLQPFLERVDRADFSKTRMYKFYSIFKGSRKMRLWEISSSPQYTLLISSSNSRKGSQSGLD